jgi:hypothetical protein
MAAGLASGIAVAEAAAFPASETEVGALTFDTNPCDQRHLRGRRQFCADPLSLVALANRTLQDDWRAAAATMTDPAFAAGATLRIRTDAGRFKGFPGLNRNRFGRSQGFGRSQT